MTFIAPREKVWSHADRIAGWQRGEKPAPVTLEWDLTNRCNLGCDGCHFAHTHTRGPLAMRSKPEWFSGSGDVADAALVMRALGEAADFGVKAVVWTGGGEPLLHRQWPYLFIEAARVGLKQGLYTHGGLIRSEDTATLSLLTWAVVSLDAVTTTAYRDYKGMDASFSAACVGVQRLVDAGVTTGVSFLLWHDNWQDAEQMLALSRALGATYTTFRPLIEVDVAQPSRPAQDRAWVTEALPLLSRLAREADVEVSAERFAEWQRWTPGSRGYDACHGIKFNATITPDGRVWLCPNRRGMDASCLGDLRTESFADLWARHPGVWTDFEQCRAMCRLHPVNQSAAAIFAPRAHAEFI